MKKIVLICAMLLGGMIASATQEVMDFWKSFDLRKEPLNVEVVKKWETPQGVFQLVRYDLGKLVGDNRTASPKIAAYYGYPKKGAKFPGIVHIHGGGQRAEKYRVDFWVKLGYACISINWGGKVIEQDDTPNTDWDGIACGFVRPGVAPRSGLDHHEPVDPSPYTLFKHNHILNSSWTLIALSARRALTFLEQRPEVDPARLGVEGHSMGGRSTVLTAIDPRVKAASPSVGGSGFLLRDLWGLPNSARRMPQPGRPYYQKTVSCQSHWGHITAPILFLGASNDFNSPTELVIDGMALLPKTTERMLVLSPHLNHRFTENTDAARFMWMEAHLKGNFTFPKTSRSRLDLTGGIPAFFVEADTSSGLPIEKVDIYYGYARDPRIRFRRSARVGNRGTTYFAHCPVFDVNEPLYVYANITYRMNRTLPAHPGKKATSCLEVTSEYQIAYPSDLKRAGIRATEKPKRMIDNFSRGWQDWFVLNGDNPQHWDFATRKVLDPSWIGPKDGKLALTLTTEKPNNRIAVLCRVNEWQFYTHRPIDTFTAIVPLPHPGENTIMLSARDFKNAKGVSMKDWDEITELHFTPAWKVQGREPADWQGKPPSFKRLWWEGGNFIPRPHPHQPRGKVDTQGRVTFDEAFQQAIQDSVKLEKMDEKSAR